MNMAQKSENSENNVEDKSSLGLNLAEDLDDEFIFHSHQSHPHIHELTMTEHNESPASQVPHKINQKNGEIFLTDS